MDKRRNTVRASVYVYHIH